MHGEGWGSLIDWLRRGPWLRQMVPVTLLIHYTAILFLPSRNAFICAESHAMNSSPSQIQYMISLDIKEWTSEVITNKKSVNIQTDWHQFCKINFTIDLCYPPIRGVTRCCNNNTMHITIHCWRYNTWTIWTHLEEEEEEEEEVTTLIPLGKLILCIWPILFIINLNDTH